MSEATFDELVEYARGSPLGRFQELWDKPVELALLLFETGSPTERTEELEAVIELSGTSKLEWDIASRIAQEALYGGQGLPQSLAGWAADVLAGKRPRPRTGSKTIARDIIFCIAVADLRDRFGLTPTKNSATGAHSACDVVAAAAGFSYKTVERAWGLREPQNPSS